MDLKIGDKVYTYEIELDFEKDKIKISKYENHVIGINEYRLCIDNKTFTSIKYRKQYKDDKDKLFGDVIIVDFTKFINFDCIIGTLYTTQADEKIAYKKVKDELEEYIYKNFGRYSKATKLLDSLNI